MKTDYGPGKERNNKLVYRSSLLTHVACTYTADLSR